MSIVNPNKRVTIVNVVDIATTGETIQAGDRVMRTTRSFADKLVASGEWRYCSKSKLKSFLNKNIKLDRNMETIRVLQEITGETFNEKRLNGKVVVLVPNFNYKLKEQEYKEVPTNPFVKVEHNPQYDKSGRKVSREYTQFIVKWEWKFHWISPTTNPKPTKKTAIHRSPLFAKPEEQTMFNTGSKILVVAF